MNIQLPTVKSDGCVLSGSWNERTWCLCYILMKKNVYKLLWLKTSDKCINVTVTLMTLASDPWFAIENSLTFMASDPWLAIENSLTFMASDPWSAIENSLTFMADESSEMGVSSGMWDSPAQHRHDIAVNNTPDNQSIEEKSWRSKWDVRTWDEILNRLSIEIQG